MSLSVRGRWEHGKTKRNVSKRGTNTEKITRKFNWLFRRFSTFLLPWRSNAFAVSPGAFTKLLVISCNSRSRKLSLTGLHPRSRVTCINVVAKHIAALSSPAHNRKHIPRDNNEISNSSSCCVSSILETVDATRQRQSYIIIKAEKLKEETLDVSSTTRE